MRPICYVYSGIKYVVQLQLPDLPEGLQVSDGSVDSLLLLHSWIGIQYDPPSCCLAADSESAPEHLGSWSWVCTGPTVNITYWFHHQFSMTTSTYSYMDARGMEHTPIHILRYMGRTSNNNNIMLINNSLCCFAIRVVYTRITATLDKCIKMRVSLFGLFLWRTYLVKL